MFTVQECLDRAADETGLDDFGAPTFRDGLDRLVDSLRGEAGLTDLGRAMGERHVIAALRNRLRIEAWWSQHPELADEKIEAPIIIVGMSRSGTTALSHLLGKDPELRSLRAWEASGSVPPPDQATYWSDPRYLAAVQKDELGEGPFPGLRALHHDPPEAPVECNSIFAHEFNSTVFTTQYFVPSYLRWMLDADASGIYAYHERMLKLLQSRCPGRWNLKGPQHGYAMEDLRRRYPDATLIVTHRDPTACTASTASLMGFFAERTSAQHDPHVVGQLTTELMQRCATGLMEDHRKQYPNGMIHVAYPDLVADPIATVRRVYEAMGRELAQRTEEAMVEHTAARPQHKYGVHRYDLADFGLQRDELDSCFEEYRETFGVELGRR